MTTSADRTTGAVAGGATTGGAPGADPRSPSRSAAIAGLLVTAVLAVVLLSWAKWVPYVGRVAELSGTGAWDGDSVLAVGGVQPGDAPTWGAATSFVAAYVPAVWKAMLAALLLAAALQTLVPREALVRVLGRRGRVSGAAVGGLLATPTMMCTCCAAPVVASMRRGGVPTAAVLGWWLGNPLLNPAVLVFLWLVAPWQWTLTRLVLGLVLVVGGSALVARLVERRGDPGAAADLLAGGAGDEEQAGSGSGGTGRTGAAGAAARFVRALLRLAVVLVPAHVLVVAVVGALRGWLFPLGGDLRSLGVLAVLLAAVVGTLLVLPTAGEIPVLQGLALAGASAGVVGALLVTLPAVSLPGAVMLGRALGWRTTAVVAAVVAAGGVAGGALLAALPGTG